jgi:hypothetical protein
MDLIVKKGSVRLPRTKPGRPGLALRVGQTVPADSLPAEDVERLLKAGILGVAVPPPEPSDPLPPRKGKWSRDPASLAGLSVKELLAAVAEIDPEFSGADDLGESALVQLLTADFDPAFRVPESSESVDRNRPSEPVLKRARARAAAGK